jgi:hypothetical protein
LKRTALIRKSALKRGSVIKRGPIQEKVCAKTLRFGKCKNQTSMLKKFERLLKPIILNRDGHKCAIEGFRHYCKDGLVMDHRPSKRGCHITFLDPRNLTTVCGNANYLAERDPFISHAIVEKVIEREGEEAYTELNHLSKSKEPKKWFQEECQKWILACDLHFKTNKNGRPVCD